MQRDANWMTCLRLFAITDTNWKILFYVLEDHFKQAPPFLRIKLTWLTHARRHILKIRNNVMENGRWNWSHYSCPYCPSFILSETASINKPISKDPLSYTLERTSNLRPLRETISFVMSFLLALFSLIISKGKSTCSWTVYSIIVGINVTDD